MNPIIEMLVNLVKGLTDEEAMPIVNFFFSHVSCMESDEWNNKMSEQERIKLINKLINYSLK